MTRKNAARKALFTSVISLLLCVSMLVGTTFAWFTDEVVSNGNKIHAGTLQIELFEMDENNEWNDITKDTDPLFYYDLWEPGFTDVTVLKVKNAGSLALTWAAIVTPINAENVTILADVIDVYVKEDVEKIPGSFAEIQETYTLAGTLRQFIKGFANNTTGVLYPEGNEEGYDFEATLGIALHMREEAGNDYQGLDLGSEFDIKIFATQMTYEKDSFDEMYDEAAALVNSDGSASVTVETAPSAGSTTVNAPAGAFEPGDEVNYLVATDNSLFNINANGAVVATLDVTLMVNGEATTGTLEEGK